MWEAIQSRKYETWRVESKIRQDLVILVLSYLQEDARVFRMPTAPGLPAGDADNLGKRRRRGQVTWFPSIRPPPESPLHGPMLGVTF